MERGDEAAFKRAMEALSLLEQQKVVAVLEDWQQRQRVSIPEQLIAKLLTFLLIQSRDVNLHVYNL